MMERLTVGNASGELNISDELNDSLNTQRASAILIVGVGSPHGDDQLGWQVARELMRRSLDCCQVRIAATPLELLDWLDDCTTLHLVDACQGNATAGAVHRWAWPCSEVQLGGWSGTHDFNLLGVLALAVQLGQLPQQVFIWGIERGNSSDSELLSTGAATWTENAANQIQREVATLSCGDQRP